MHTHKHTFIPTYIHTDTCMYIHTYTYKMNDKRKLCDPTATFCVVNRNYVDIFTFGVHCKRECH